MNQSNFISNTKNNLFLKFTDFIATHFKFILCFVYFIGFFARLYNLGNLPVGLNQDEAYAGYEAYSLLNYGFDSHGYTNPVYFISWGSGMNVLYSYLTIPFLLLTGNHLTAFAIRIPQAFFSCISLIVFYFLLDKLFHNKYKALLGLFIFAIAPWHIMLAHWGLESNIAPAFLLFGLFFWIKGIENSKFYILSAILYGLSLYAYAPLWIAVPAILILQLIYSIYCNQFKWDKFFSIALVLLFLIALPLLLFILINNGTLPEIKTGIFSIPKLLEYRGGEISLQNIKVGIHNFFTLFTTQNDQLIWNSTPRFGLYYKFSIIFIIIGLCSLAKTSIVNIKNRTYNPLLFIFINIMVSIVFAILISNINVNKINMIHIPLVICCIQGIITASSFFKKAIYPFVILAYTFSFIVFLSFYFTSYNSEIKEPFQYGVEETVAAALSKTDSIICINSDIFYSNILFATQIPVTNYLSTVSYDPNLPYDFTPISFDRFVFGYDTNTLDNNYVYIIDNNDLNDFTDKNFQCDTYGNYSVAYYTN
ncbi:MAG: ArnT family glycosyltransferase [Lachnotalea sp.]